LIRMQFKVVNVDGIGMDTMHYIEKWPIFYKGLKDSSLNEVEKKFYDEILQGETVRLEKNVSVFENGVYKLTNYMDGTNGV